MTGLWHALDAFDRLWLGWLRHSADGRQIDSKRNNERVRYVAGPRNQFKRSETAQSMLPLSRCFVRAESKLPRFFLSDKGVGEPDASDLLSILKVFTEKNSALPLDRSSDDH